MPRFDGIAGQIHAWARSKGFYDREWIACVDPVTGDVEGRTENPSLPSEKLMLIVTEVAEAQEALRDGDRANEAEEVADILIRVLDFAAWRGISLDREVAAKMAKNEIRPTSAWKGGVLMASDPDTLTTLVLTVGERVKLARCVVIATAMVDALGDDVGHLMDLAERISPTEGGEW